jgi:hypothetical protein
MIWIIETCEGLHPSLNSNLLKFSIQSILSQRLEDSRVRDDLQARAKYIFCRQKFSFSNF